MARTDSLEHFLTDAAAAIRLKSGTSAQMNSNEMINNINSWTSESVREEAMMQVLRLLFLIVSQRHILII